MTIAAYMMLPTLFFAFTISALSHGRDAGMALLDSDSTNSSEKWMMYKQIFSKNYSSTTAEENAYANFLVSERSIQSHNSKGRSYRLGHNQFSDMTLDDFHHTFVSGIDVEALRGRKINYMNLANLTAPAEIDWASKGAVTPVKNQAHCGSCWAFSTTGAMEGAYQIATGRLLSFSEEQVVDCDSNMQGCKGGTPDSGFDYVHGNGGLCSEADYPYSAQQGQAGYCRASTCTAVVTTTGHSDVPPNDESALATAVGLAPVSILVQAKMDDQGWMLYRGGVFDDPTCTGRQDQIDHAVLAVGYGSGYWKVKNSWDTTWGEAGYIRLARGKNMCGLTFGPSIPTGVSAVGPAPTPGPGPAPTPTPGPAPTPTPAPGPSPSGCKPFMLQAGATCDLVAAYAKMQCPSSYTIQPPVCTTPSQTPVGGTTYKLCCGGSPGPAPGPNPTPAPGPTPGPAPTPAPGPSPSGCKPFMLQAGATCDLVAAYAKMQCPSSYTIQPPVCTTPSQTPVDGTTYKLCCG